MGVFGSLFGVTLRRPGIVKDTDFLTCDVLVPLRRQDEGGFLEQLLRLFGDRAGLSRVNVSLSSSPSDIVSGLAFPVGLPVADTNEECCLMWKGVPPTNFLPTLPIGETLPPEELERQMLWAVW